MLLSPEKILGRARATARATDGRTDGRARDRPRPPDRLPPSPLTSPLTKPTLRRLTARVHLNQSVIALKLKVASPARAQQASDVALALSTPYGLCIMRDKGKSDIQENNHHEQIYKYQIDIIQLKLMNDLCTLHRHRGFCRLRLLCAAAAARLTCGDSHAEE